MSSRKPKRAASSKTFQRLRSATNSNAVNKTSIIVDASKYIEELKGKVERLQQDVATSSDQTSALPMVTVETLENGFLINVFSERNCPGLLVSILQAFEQLGLDVLDASVSCSDNFRLEAVGGENQGQEESIDAQVVKQAVLQAIRNWSTEGNEQD
ncbi:uncharacterized protein LOC127790616 isoform X2 [Diospyros lotus]|uniref:uncharacterized protein LOC127790616 isoform X2 n=1 Tax=Diospyros lotus TaxID=55363 RepID=UPI00224E980F|nr:uncharacterized protein LOC127790616 isoform X2 [Diospyros lotus]